MKKSSIYIWLTLLLTTACATVPISGRKQMNLLKESTLHEMAFSQYQEMMTESQLASDFDEDKKLIQKVGDKIAKACEAFLKKNGQSKRIQGFEWEFNLIKDDQVNAWCMPGGKIAFYTGIMPVCKDEAGVAVVMSHEIAHAVARHGNERMSQQMTAQMGGMALGAALGEDPGLTADLFKMSYGAGAQLGTLAFSRQHESEADKMGLVFMEFAGYDAGAAVNFWERMAALGGDAPPVLLATHPSNEKRIAEIREYIPVAKSMAIK